MVVWGVMNAVQDEDDASNRAAATATIGTRLVNLRVIASVFLSAVFYRL